MIRDQLAFWAKTTVAAPSIPLVVTAALGALLAIWASHFVNPATNAT